MDKIEHQNKHFESISERYYKARQGTNHLMYKRLLFEYVLQDLSKRINRDKTLAVLEPMCGYGEGREIIKSYLTENITYEGFDYNDTLIGKEKELHPDVNIYKQDVTTFHATKKYDIVILIGGLHHVPDYAESVVREIYNSLENGGFFINFEPTHNNPFIGFARSVIYKMNSLFDETTEHGFSLKELNHMYKTCGFRRFRQFYPGLPGYIMYYNPDAFPLLNIGNEKTVKTLFDMEKEHYRSRLGRFLSFCTFTILIKP